MRPRQGPSGFAAALLAIAGYLAWRVLAPYLTPLAWAVVFATVAYPMYERLVRRFRGRRSLAGLAACVLVCALLIVPVVWLAFAVARQSIDAYAALQRLVTSQDFDALVKTRVLPMVSGVLDLLPAGTVDTARLQDGLLAMMGRVTSFLVSNTTAIVTGFAGVVFSASLMLIAMYCFFLDGPAIVRRLRGRTPLTSAQEDLLIACFRDVTVATMYGGVVTAVVQGLVGAIIFLALGLPSPLVWGAAMAVASFIPIIGTALIWGPAALYFLATGAWVRGVVLVALGVLVIGSIDNIVKPLVVRGRMRMHLLLVFLGILGGLQLFGMLGLVIGPVVLAMALTLLEIYQQEVRASMRDRAA